MNCPKCASQPLKPERGPGGVEVDRCDACKGLWLDKGELAKYHERGGDLSAAIEKGFEFSVPTSRACPKCSRKMKQARLGPGRVLVDRCASCGGLWLDDSELQAVLALPLS